MRSRGPRPEAHTALTQGERPSSAELLRAAPATTTHAKFDNYVLCDRLTKCFAKADGVRYVRESHLKKGEAERMGSTRERPGTFFPRDGAQFAIPLPCCGRASFRDGAHVAMRVLLAAILMGALAASVLVALSVVVIWGLIILGSLHPDNATGRLRLSL